MSITPQNADAPLIYVVDDEVHIRRLAQVALEDHGMKVQTFGSGNEAIAALRQQKPDLIILDWMMPPPDGIAVCRTIRETPDWAALPVIILTARTEEMDRVLGLELGADDYITKPFGVRELPARVRAVLRRGRMADAQDDIAITIGPLSIDAKRRRVSLNGTPIDLTTREFDLLYLLMQHPGQVFTRDQLLDRVWNTTYYGDTRTVDVHIRYVRQKIEPTPDGPTFIRTVRGVGYAFEAPES